MGSQARQGDEHPAYALVEYGPFTFTYGNDTQTSKKSRANGSFFKI